MKLYNILMIYSQDEKELLFCRRKKDPYKGKLNFPGGKVEKNEFPRNAAYRELFEETGIRKTDISDLFHMMDFVYHNTERTVELYIGRLRHDVEIVSEAGGNQLQWVRIEGTDFSDQGEFAGDGNILHCFLMGEKYKDHFDGFEV